MHTVLIAGGTGLIGQRLSQLLKEKGYKVIHLSRNENLDAEFPAYQWDLEKKTLDERAIEQADYVINLAGAGIADKPWSDKRKELIISSRTETTRLLKTYLEKQPAKAYLAASAIGFYGDRDDELLTETSPAGESGFLAESTKLWEEAIHDVEKTGVRTVLFRIGLVLSSKGGALPQLIMPLNFRVGGYFGNGKQWYSWIHIDDLCRMFIYGLENEQIQGTFNAVAPNPETNKEFIRKTSEGMGKPAWLMPVPVFGIRLVFGEMADAVLTSSKVSSNKIVEAGFNFKFEGLEEAVEDVLSREV